MSAGYGERTPSQRVWLVGAAALVVLMLIGGSWLVWQGLTSTPVTSNHAPPVGGRADTESVVALGPTEIVDGVPWGFRHTPGGAVAAAVTAVAVTGQRDVVFDPARFAQVAALVFDEQTRTAQEQQVEAARTEFELSGWAHQPESRRLYFFTPLAARLVAYAPNPPSAQVEVWAMTLVGAGDAGGAVFTTSTIDLTAREATWTVTNVDSVEGPTPLAHASSSPPGRTRALLRDATPTWPLPLPPVAVQR